MRIGLLISVFVAVLAGFALLAPGLLPTHDGEYHVIRFYEFDKVLRSGVLYPRWAPDLNNGYGVPLFNYVYPFPSYISSLFHAFGISFIDAFKYSMFFALILGAIFFFLWARMFWGNAGGMVASIFYSFSPYHFVDIYIRGSVGEVWALAFFPGLLWATTSFAREKRELYLILSSIFLGLLVLSHNILALLFFIFYLFYLAVLLPSDIQIRKKIVLSILLGLGISAIFWMPALFEKSYVTGLQIYDVRENFPKLYQLLIPSWGSGFSGESVENQMSFQVGIANLLAVVISIPLLLLIFRKKLDNRKRSVFFFLISFFVVFYLMLSSSYIIWQKIPLFDYFQFPWRLLSLEILIASFLAGFPISLLFFSKRLPKVAKTVGFIFLALLPIIFGLGYAKPAYYHYRNDSYYTSRSNFIDGTNSPGNLFNTVWMNNKLPKRKEKLLFISEVTIKKQSIKPERSDFILDSSQKTRAFFSTAYFPGWNVTVDGRQIKTEKEENGLITFLLKNGEHNVSITLENTFVRGLAGIITLFSLLSLLLLRKFATI